MAESSTIKNALLMLAPVAVLVALGVLLQNRQPAVLTVPGPFQVFAKRIRQVPLKPKEVQDGYDTKVEVELEARGRTPAWWQSGFSGYLSTNEGKLVVVGKGAARQPDVPWHTRPHLEKTNSGTSRWITSYLCKLTPISANAGDIRLRHRIDIVDSNVKYGNPVWLDTIVRRNGQATQHPEVPHDSQLLLKHWRLDESPPVENFSGNGRYQWQLSLWFRKNGPLSKADQDGVSDNLNMRDGNGRTGSLGGSMMSTSVPTNFATYSPYSLVEKSDPRLTFIQHNFNDTGTNAPLTTQTSNPKPPLWIEGKANRGDLWPLWIKTPLRDATGKVLLTPRPAPAFKVISTTARVATPGEQKDNGADNAVDVVLEAIQPGADVSQWEWDGHFSQHVQDAKGHQYWVFPFKGTRSKGTSPISYKTSTPGLRMTLSYLLNLSAIPQKAGPLTFQAEICANKSQRVLVSIKVR